MSCVETFEAMQAHFREHPTCCDGGRAGMCAEGDRLYAAHLAEMKRAIDRIGSRPVATSDALAMLDYCAVNAERIFVRENLPGQGWGAYPLSDLPVSVALGHVRRWLSEGRQPVVVRESGGSLPAECPCGEGKNPLHAFLNCGQAPLLNKSGGSDVPTPWPLCAARVGCLVRVEVAGSYCRKHGGAGPW